MPDDVIVVSALNSAESRREKRRKSDSQRRLLFFSLAFFFLLKQLKLCVKRRFPLQLEHPSLIGCFQICPFTSVYTKAFIISLSLLSVSLAPSDNDCPTCLVKSSQVNVRAGRHASEASNSMRDKNSVMRKCFHDASQPFNSLEELIFRLLLQETPVWGRITSATSHSSLGPPPTVPLLSAAEKKVSVCSAKIHIFTKSVTPRWSVLSWELLLTVGDSESADLQQKDGTGTSLLQRNRKRNTTRESKPKKTKILNTQMM